MTREIDKKNVTCMKELINSLMDSKILLTMIYLQNEINTFIFLGNIFP